MRMRLRMAFVQVVAMMGILALTTPASAQFTENAVGTVSLQGGNTVVVNTAAAAASKVWFGLRVFTVPAGTMVTHSVLTTPDTSLAYSPQAVLPNGRVMCISDFAGKGSPTGGIAGPFVPESAAEPADRGIAMIGGFAGPGTGCVNEQGAQSIHFQMTTPGPIIQAFYGAFWGTSPAPWRADMGSATGNQTWWNLWGNFTALGFGSTG
jgi:hypothetical protein